MWSSNAWNSWPPYAASALQEPYPSYANPPPDLTTLPPSYFHQPPPSEVPFPSTSSRESYYTPVTLTTDFDDNDVSTNQMKQVTEKESEILENEAQIFINQCKMKSRSSAYSPPKSKRRCSYSSVRLNASLSSISSTPVQDSPKASSPLNFPSSNRSYVTKDEALECLWELHEKEYEHYRQNPMEHPQYHQEREIWNKHMIQKGFDIYNHVVVLQWKLFWEEMIERLFRKSWKKKKDNFVTNLPPQFSTTRNKRKKVSPSATPSLTSTESDNSPRRDIDWKMKESWEAERRAKIRDERLKDECAAKRDERLNEKLVSLAMCSPKKEESFLSDECKDKIRNEMFRERLLSLATPREGESFWTDECKEKIRDEMLREGNSQIAVAKERESSLPRTHYSASQHNSSASRHNSSPSRHNFSPSRHDRSSRLKDDSIRQKKLPKSSRKEKSMKSEKTKEKSEKIKVKSEKTKLKSKKREPDTKISRKERQKLVHDIDRKPLSTKNRKHLPDVKLSEKDGKSSSKKDKDKSKSIKKKTSKGRERNSVKTDRKSTVKFSTGKKESSSKEFSTVDNELPPENGSEVSTYLKNIEMAATQSLMTETKCASPEELYLQTIIRSVQHHLSKEMTKPSSMQNMEPTKQDILSEENKFPINDIISESEKSLYSDSFAMKHDHQPLFPVKMETVEHDYQIFPVEIDPIISPVKVKIERDSWCAVDSQDTPLEEGVGHSPFLDLIFVLKQLGDKFGNFSKPVGLLYDLLCKAHEVGKCLFNFIDDDSEALLIIIKTKIEKFLSQEDISLVQKAIYQETFTSLVSFLKEIHRKKAMAVEDGVESTGINIEKIAKATEGKDCKDTIDFIKLILANRNIDVNSSKLMNIYLQVKESQVCLFKLNSSNEICPSVKIESDDISLAKTDSEHFGFHEDSKTDQHSSPKTKQHSSSKTVPHSSSKTDHRSSSKTDHRSSSKADHRSSSKTDHRSSSKTDHRSSSKTDQHSSSKTDHRSSSKTDHRSSSKTDHRSSSKTDHRSSSKTDHRSSSKTDHRSSSKTDHRSSSKTDHHSSSKTDHHSSSKTNHHSSSKIDQHSSSRPSSSKTDHHPSSKTKLELKPTLKSEISNSTVSSKTKLELKPTLTSEISSSTISSKNIEQPSLITEKCSQPVDKGHQNHKFKFGFDENIRVNTMSKYKNVFTDIEVKSSKDDDDTIKKGAGSTNNDMNKSIKVSSNDLVHELFSDMKAVRRKLQQMPITQLMTLYSNMRDLEGEQKTFLYMHLNKLRNTNPDLAHSLQWLRMKNQ